MMMVMRSLNRVLPLLKLYLSTPGVHPWQVYVLLIQLVGELSTFNDDCTHLGEWSHDDLGMKGYDHQELMESFTQVQHILQALLNSFALEDNSYQKLTRDERNIYTGQLDRQILTQSKGVYLMLRTEEFATKSLLIDKLAGARLAERSVIESLIQHALPGSAIALCQKTPGGLPKRGDTRYLSIDTGDRLWLRAEQTQQISFFWTHAPEDLQVQIVYTGVR